MDKLIKSSPWITIQKAIKKAPIWGRGCGQVASVLSFYSDDPNFSPAQSYSFFCKICSFYENKNIAKKEAGVGPFKIAPICLSRSIISLL